MATTKSTKTTGFAKMFDKTHVISILTATTLGIFPFTAAFANPNPCCKPTGGDNAVIQTSSQDATVTGSGNNIRQGASQSSNSSYRSGTGDQGIVQDQTQFGNSSGHGNHVNQNVRQSNSSQPQATSSGRTGRRPAVNRPASRPSTCNNTCPTSRKGGI